MLQRISSSSITWKIVWNYFLGNLISVAKKDVLGIILVRTSGWSVRMAPLQNEIARNVFNPQAWPR